MSKEITSTTKDKIGSNYLNYGNMSFPAYEDPIPGVVKQPQQAFPMGWVCPKCGAVMSPSQKTCPNCTSVDYSIR